MCFALYIALDELRLFVYRGIREHSATDIDALVS